MRQRQRAGETPGLYRILPARFYLSAANSDLLRADRLWLLIFQSRCPAILVLHPAVITHTADNPGVLHFTVFRLIRAIHIAVIGFHLNPHATLRRLAGFALAGTGWRVSHAAQWILSRQRGQW